MTTNSEPVLPHIFNLYYIPHKYLTNCTSQKELKRIEKVFQQQILSNNEQLHGPLGHAAV
jgi:hypothetical protein